MRISLRNIRLDSTMEKDRNKIIKKIDEFETVASQQKLPEYGYGSAVQEATSMTEPEMIGGKQKKIEKQFRKEFGTISSGGFTPTYGGDSWDTLNNKIVTLQTLSKKREVEKKIDDILSKSGADKPKTPLQEKILETIERFEKLLEQEVETQKFIKSYQKLALLSKSFSNKELGILYNLAKQINSWKEFNISIPQEIDRLEQIIFVDSVAHNLHKQKDFYGESIYKQFDELADISKMAGEFARQDRLIIFQAPIQNKQKLESLAKVEILQKGLLEKSKSFWGLFEKAVKEGIGKLSNSELVLLREFLFSRI